MNLASKECSQCRGDTSSLPDKEIRRLFNALHGWQLVDNHRLLKRYEFADFASALEWVNTIGAISETQQHHPNIKLAWGEVEAEIWTHRINALTESDFILAAKFDAAEQAASLPKL